ncbi:MAG TPA: S8 family peptidase [Polyangiaceae bacterium]|nr:S8 family peptidase [Polyangiaceae bacterium]
MSSPSRPLLISPSGSKQPFTPQQPRGGGPSNPKKARQIERLAPKFTELQQAIDARRGALQADAAGVALEQVLVFETNGPVQDLYDTVAKTPGLEWLADEDIRDLAPDEDFFVADKPDKPVNAQLYLVLFNQQAVEQLLSLWRLWSTGARLPEEHRGWLDVFRQLRDIRRWGVRDRLEETGILAYWRDRVATGFETVGVEIELWFRQAEKRSSAEGRVRDSVTRANGQVLASCTIDEIAYHALVCKLPIAAAQGMLDDPEVELLQCDEVRLVRPTGQAAAPIVAEEPEQEEGAGEGEEAALRDPVVALLDGLPLENHRRLAGRLVVDDPDEWAETYPVASRCHGTAMASLILHGDLGANEEPARQRLYVRPIMRPDSFGGRSEQAPEDLSWVDLIHRAVRRIVAGDGNLPPAAPSVRVINLSIGDPYQPFIRSMSPLAKLLDWLSWRYRVLFVVSAGNHRAPITIAGRAEELKPEAIVAAVAGAQRHRRILSPAEAVNALSVGATAEDASGAWKPRASNEHDLALPEGFPSPISGLGRGYRRVVKPDVLAPGGRVVFLAGDDANGDTKFELADPRPRIPPGHRVAAPSATQGDLSGVRYSAGTSNAAALVSRAALRIADALQDLGDQPNAAQLARVPMALWLRTLLAHGASWSSGASKLVERALRTESNKHTFTDEVSALLAFGTIQPERVIACTEERVTILAGGDIAADERYVHRIPLPASLNAHTAWRRLTVTLSWFSPINPTHRKYRRAALWFEPPGQRELLVQRRGVDWRAVRRGTLQHEVLEGDRGAINVQPDGHLEIPVTCLAHAGSLDERVPYAMAITLEIAPGVKTKIYDEVRARVTARVPVRPRA